MADTRIFQRGPSRGGLGTESHREYGVSKKLKKK